MNKIQLTQTGFESLETEYKELQEIKRPQAVDRLQKARSMGDLKENSEYHAARESLSFIDSRMLEIEEIMKNHEIVQSGGSTSAISVGNTVIAQVNGEKQEFQIVGDFEADITKQKLSQNSPIGHALIGKRVGEKVEVVIPSGKIIYNILQVK